MPIFGATEFDEAIKTPKLRIKATDPDIKNGQVEELITQTNVGPLSEPYRMQGGFAVVYKFKKANQKQIALRCLMKDIATDMKERYDKIGQYLKKNAKDISADFTFYEQGIKVQNSGGAKIFPIIDMEWVEGLNLDHKIDDLCKKNDKVGLGKLLEAWRNMIGKMKVAKVAHSDLASGNVKVRPNGDLVLIDYDGMYIPDLAGRDALTYGQPPFQHPKMARPYDEFMDEFAIMVIFTALAALRETPSLWKDYAKYDVKGNFISEGILFEKTDFENPGASNIFKKIKVIQHKEVQDAIKALETACGQRPEQVRVPTWMIDPDLDKKDALSKLVQAITSDNDDSIIAGWVSLLDAYPPAQIHRPRVELARKRGPALMRFQASLSKNDDDLIQAYDPIIEPKLSAEEKRKFTEAKKRLMAYAEFTKALAQPDDRVIIAVWQKHVLILEKYYKVTQAQKNAKSIAESCVSMDTALRKALADKNDEEIASIYKETLKRGWMNISVEQQARIIRAQSRAPRLKAFRQAIASKDHLKIQAAYLGLQNDDLRETNLSDIERKELELAKKRTEAVELFRFAVVKNQQGGFENLVVDKYDTVLDNSNLVLPSERIAYEKAKYCVDMPTRVRTALTADDDELILKAYDAALERPFMSFTPIEHNRIQLAQKRAPKYRAFIAALNNSDDEGAVKAYHTDLDQYSKISRDQWKQFEAAKLRFAAWQRLNIAIKQNDDVAINEAALALPDNYAKISIQDRPRIQTAKTRHQAYQKLILGIGQNNDEAILHAANAGARAYSALSAKEKDAIQYAQDRKKQFELFIAALKSDDDAVIKPAYTAILDGHPQIMDVQRKRLALANERLMALSKFKDALKKGKYHEVEWVEVYDRNSCLHTYDKLSAQDREAVALGRRCIAMPSEVRKAIQQDDDTAIIAAHIPDLERDYSKFNDTEKVRIQLAKERLTALAKMQTAIKNNNDAEIVSAYVPLLHGYKGVTTSDKARAELADRRQAALKKFRKALSAAVLDERLIVAAYDSVLDNSQDVFDVERTALSNARACVAMPVMIKTAIAQNDDQAIVAAFSEKWIRPFTFDSTNEEQVIRSRVKLAQARVMALKQLAMTLITDVTLEHDEAIVKVYDMHQTILDESGSVSPQQRQRVKLARDRIAAVARFRNALNSQNEKGVVAQYEIDKLYLDRLGDDEKTKLKQAQLCVEMPAKIKVAIATGSDRKIMQAYQPALVRGCMDADLAPLRPHIETAQQRVIALNLFAQALATDADLQIIQSYQKILDQCSDVTPEQRSRLAYAQKRQQALTKFLQAANGDDITLCAAYNSILDGYSGVSAGLHQRYEAAKAYANIVVQLQQAVRNDDDAKITQLYTDGLERYIGYTNDATLSARVRKAIERQVALNALQEALKRRDEREIKRVYAEKANVLDGWAKVTHAEREQVKIAQDCVAMQEAVRKALATNNDKGISVAYQASLVRPWMGFTGQDQELIEEAIKRVATAEKVRQALDSGRVGDAIRYERQAGLLLNDETFNNAKKNYIANLEPSNIRAKLDQGVLTVQWDWNSDPAVESVVIIWSPQTYPTSAKPLPIGSTSTRVEVSRTLLTRGELVRKIGDKMVYVRLFSALRYTDSSKLVQWHYSSGLGKPAAMAIARERVTIICQLKKPLGSPQNELLLKTKDGSPLPNLVIRAKSNNLPNSPKDGELVQCLDQLTQLRRSEATVALTLSRLPKNAILRVFAADDNELDRITPYPLKIELCKPT